MIFQDESFGWEARGKNAFYFRRVLRYICTPLDNA